MDCEQGYNAGPCQPPAERVKGEKESKSVWFLFWPFSDKSWSLLGGKSARGLVATVPMRWLCGDLVYISWTLRSV